MMAREIRWRYRLTPAGFENATSGYRPHVLVVHQTPCCFDRRLHAEVIALPKRLSYRDFWKNRLAFPKQISRTIFPRYSMSSGYWPDSTSPPMYEQRILLKYSNRG